VNKDIHSVQRTTLRELQGRHPGAEENEAMFKNPTLTDRGTKAHDGWHESDLPRRLNKRMVLCLGNLPQAAVIERFFQERGWIIRLAVNGDEARQLARDTDNCVVVLAEEAPEHESGWLTCWKLLNKKSKTRVVIIGDQESDLGIRQAAFVGATAYVNASESARGICRALHDADHCDD